MKQEEKASLFFVGKCSLPPRSLLYKGTLSEAQKKQQAMLKMKIPSIKLAIIKRG